MRLSARILQNVSGVNGFSYANQAEMTQGDTPTIYFQLVDASLDRPEQGFVPAGRRYMPAAGATLTVVLDSIDDSKKVTRVATQPFAQDPSIWAIPILSTDKIRGTVNMKLTLTESGQVTQGMAATALLVAGMDGLTGWGR